MVLIFDFLSHFPIMDMAGWVRPHAHLATTSAKSEKKVMG